METKNSRHRITQFTPRRKELSFASNAELSSFDAGEGFEVFNDYIKGEDAINDAENGLGATHLIYDYSANPPCIIAYFTIVANVIPYNDGISENPDLEEYPSIPVFEIRMFAVDKNYQDVFFSIEGEDLPISAWCIRYIVDYAIRLSNQIVGVQGLYLHALKSAENFYDTNGFIDIHEAMHPLFSIDSGLRPMWMRIRGQEIKL